MGGKLLAWHWGGGGEKHKPKDRTKSVNKSGKFRKVIIPVLNRHVSDV